MSQQHFGARLLAALAATPPAFASVGTEEHGHFGRRLLAALAGTTPAFTSGYVDEFRSSSVNTVDPGPTTQPPSAPATDPTSRIGKGSNTSTAQPEQPARVGDDSCRCELSMTGSDRHDEFLAVIRRSVDSSANFRSLTQGKSVVAIPDLGDDISETVRLIQAELSQLDSNATIVFNRYENPPNDDKGSEGGESSRIAHSKLRVRQSPREALSNMLIRLAGADPAVVRHSPLDRMRFQFVGMSLLLTMIMTTAALTLILDQSGLISSPLGLPLALLMAVFFTTMERWLLASVISQSRARTRLLAVVPRLFLAAVISVVITQPVVMAVFSAEITTRAAQARVEDSATLVDKFRTETLLPLEVARASYEREYNAMAQELRHEIEGTGGTGVPGHWEQTQYLQQQANIARERIGQLDAQIRFADQRVEEFATGQSAAISSRPYGLLEQLSAWSEVDAAKDASAIISLIILLIEISPTLAIFLSRLRGPSFYEQFVQLNEEYDLREREIGLQIEAARELRARIAIEGKQLEELQNGRSAGRPIVSETNAEADLLSTRIQTSEETTHRVNELAERFKAMEALLTRDRQESLAQIIPLRSRRAG